MSPSNRADSRIVLGGVPRADLLPPELELEKKARATRRGLVFIVVLVTVLTAVVYAGTTAVAAAAQFTVDAANARTGDLIQEQSKYIEVRQVQAKVDAAKQARLVGTATEVDWLGMRNTLADLVPEDFAVQAWTINTATPFAAYGDTTVPFERPRQMEMLLGGVSLDAESVSSFIENITQLPGYADATLTQLSWVAEADVYMWAITVHLDEGAFSNRFATATEGEATDE